MLVSPCVGSLLEIEGEGEKKSRKAPQFFREQWIRVLENSRLFVFVLFHSKQYVHFELSGCKLPVGNLAVRLVTTPVIECEKRYNHT